MLLVFVTIIAAGCAVVSQIGMGTAEFVITDVELELNENNRVKGYLRWEYVGPEHVAKSAWPFDCEIQNVDKTELMTLKPGTKSFVRYRVRELGPLKKQDPFGMYISERLGIPKSQIVGYAILDDHTEVYIRGNQ